MAQELYIFGFVARGDDHPESDVDVLVEFQPDSHPTLFTLAVLLHAASAAMTCDVCNVGQ